ncbi:MAG: D-alanyl-D-alanine carboxypeptidase, partial [Parabacteroides sp.]|nr:D-alanyl-D-alanine carboxypeptidase [Parabacteroides sp.]
DPSLGSSYFKSDGHRFLDTWIAALQKVGIRSIKGTVIADESIFDTEGASVKWLREDMGNYYAPGCYGLSVFDNLYQLSFQTGAVGSSPKILQTQPDVSFIQFKNYLKVVAASSDSAYIIGAPLVPVRYLYGTLPANREQYVIKGDIPDPALFLAQYLTERLQKKGIKVEGEPSCYRLEKEQNRWGVQDRQTIVTTYSPPLKEIARVCNHVSHNLYADALLKTVGLGYKPNKNEAISSFGQGIAVIKNYWKERGLDVFPLKMNDGSGLAPTNKISAAFLGELLMYMATRSKVSEAFLKDRSRASYPLR